MKKELLDEFDVASKPIEKEDKSDYDKINDLCRHLEALYALQIQNLNLIINQSSKLSQIATLNLKAFKAFRDRK